MIMTRNKTVTTRHGFAVPPLLEKEGVLFDYPQTRIAIFEKRAGSLPCILPKIKFWRKIMITKANHFSIFVLDQTSAYDFYVNKLGFKVNTDAEMGPKGRWLTVNPPEQPDVEITLMAIDDKMMFNAESAATMRELVKAGTFGFAVFECDDMLATYEELKAKGVHFKKGPTKEFYGFNAVFEDDSGNWFSLSEAKKD